MLSCAGYPLSDFKPRKSGTEWAGKCPVHKPKKNSTAFSYNVDGRFACFSCAAKGRGSHDLRTSASERSRVGLPATLNTRSHTDKAQTCDCELATSSRVVSRRCRSQRPAWAWTKHLPVRREGSCNRRCRGESCRCVFARLYGPERDLGRDASQATGVDANQAIRQPSFDWLRTTHRVTTELGRTTSQKRRRRRHRLAWTMIAAS